MRRIIASELLRLPSGGEPVSVKEILFDRKLFRLLRIRWTGQLTDGIFQSALASFVLFSPERQADAMSAALAFALVLVP
jgi:hypothetical protein